MPHRVLVIVGSMRPDSRTAKVATLVESAVRAAGMEADLLDPRKTPLAFPGQADHDACAQPIRERVGLASGAVFVTPEYDGSYSAILKLVIEHFGYPSDLAGKPASVIGCAGGRIGAVKAIEHLRGLLNHTGVIVLPLAHSIPHVYSVFDDQGECLDATVVQGIANVVGEMKQFLDMTTS